jgi:hypothetical protein
MDICWQYEIRSYRIGTSVQQFGFLCQLQKFYTLSWWKFNGELPRLIPHSLAEVNTVTRSRLGNPVFWETFGKETFEIWNTDFRTLPGNSGLCLLIHYISSIVTEFVVLNFKKILWEYFSWIWRLPKRKIYLLGILYSLISRPVLPKHLQTKPVSYIDMFSTMFIAAAKPSKPHSRDSTWREHKALCPTNKMVRAVVISLPSFVFNSFCHCLYITQFYSFSHLWGPDDLLLSPGFSRYCVIYL